VTDNNGTVWTNTYDSVDRLTATSVARGAGVIGTTSNTFQYDGLHRKTLLADNNDPLAPASTSTLGLAYDSLGRIVEETQNGLAVDSGWTAHARRTSLTYPNDRRVDFAFDAFWSDPGHSGPRRGDRSLPAIPTWAPAA
jgi:uncharacterized protein RhaS with RHS repeats